MIGMLMEISLNDLYVDPRSRAKCLFVKYIRKKKYNFVFNVNNLPLAPQSKKIYSNSLIRTTTATTITKFEQSRCDDSGATMHIQEKMTHLRARLSKVLRLV